MAIPCSLATSGMTGVVSLIASAITAAWRSVISSDSRWTVGLHEGQVAQLAAPDLGRDGGDGIHGGEHVVADRGGGADAGRAGSDELAQLVLDLLVAVDDQPFFARKVVVDRLLRDLGFAGRRH